MWRRRRTSQLDFLFDVAALLPWWVGVVLAAIAYFGLHTVAVSQPPPAEPGGVGGLATHALWRGLALALQYIVPLILLGGAAASAITGYKRKTLIAEVAGGEGAGVLGGMTWQEFEGLVSEVFKLQGYAVTETGGSGADGGVDLVLKKGKEMFLVQCKQWRAFKVSVTIVRELYGVMAAQHAAGGFVVTSGKFTADAMEFARGRNIELLDGENLFAMLGTVRKKTPAPPQKVSAAPACPKCGKAMVQRVAKQGTNAGRPFWGCSGFPDCRGVRPVA